MPVLSHPQWKCSLLFRGSLLCFSLCLWCCPWAPGPAALYTPLGCCLLWQQLSRCQTLPQSLQAAWERSTLKLLLMIKLWGNECRSPSQPVSHHCRPGWPYRHCQTCCGCSWPFLPPAVVVMMGLDYMQWKLLKTGLLWTVSSQLSSLTLS